MAFNKWYLRIAQIFGLFPVQGLWTSAEFPDGLEFTRFSLIMLYSWVTLLLRFWIKSVFMDWADGPRSLSSVTDAITAEIGFTTTFCTGVIFQAATIYKTKRFLILLKKLDEYDQAWPQLPQQSSRNAPTGTGLACPFLILNAIFLLAVTAFPVSLVVGMCICTFNGAEFDFSSRLTGFKDIYSEVDTWSQVTAISVTILVLLLSEVATIFPMMQLSYFVGVMQRRLTGIYESLMECMNACHKADEQYDYLVKMSKSDTKLWTQITLAGKEGLFGKQPLRNEQFWKKMAQQYLDFTGVYQAFSKFSGTYFVVLYPIQIVSCVSIMYLSWGTTTFMKPDYVNWIFKCIIGMSLMRIWTMCCLGRGVETEHDKLLKKTLAQDIHAIGDKEEKVQYAKFLELVKSIPIQLNASGYFTVGGGNIPGIIAALVSYIIVLFQFKSAETPNSSGSLGNVSGNGL